MGGRNRDHADDPTYDPAAASHRALRGIRRELDRHPLVTTVRGFPAGEHTQVVAEVATERVGIDAADASVTVRWFAGNTPDSRPEFSIHYSDETGDCGWHHEPNPHVEGWGHVQERTAGETAYAYDAYCFGSHNPTRVIWEVMSRLSSRLDSQSSA
jgi:hypothetical protein